GRGGGGGGGGRGGGGVSGAGGGGRAARGGGGRGGPPAGARARPRRIRPAAPSHGEFRRGRHTTKLGRCSNRDSIATSGRAAGRRWRRTSRTLRATFCPSSTSSSRRCCKSAASRSTTRW